MSGEDTPQALLIQSVECQSYELEVAGSSPAQSIKENIFFYIMNTKLCKVCNTEKDVFIGQTFSLYGQPIILEKVVVYEPRMAHSNICKQSRNS